MKINYKEELVDAICILILFTILFAILYFNNKEQDNFNGRNYINYNLFNPETGERIK